ncbi:WXG100 family type VII secretion target [Mycobacteroides salmoniphilum]|uniref:6 kDa early secretory antigenic target n=1 Tax=Mycobacteroides salmoniphilum TaxID=404941 RepID=A0A4R8SZS6_9MYCO|nr:WXG100 family type VII secretion target [Mycobacteroides salmoniphilum]TEA09125.1 6 kDa early secretory antigenic target [Mycobacteroides salmoniphilum]
MAATGEQVWDFLAIEAGKNHLLLINKKIHATGEALQSGLTKLASIWGGQGSEAWNALQNRLHQKLQSVNESLASLANAIGESNMNMQRTEHSVTGRFT